MKTILRHILTAIFLSFLLSFIIVGVTLAAFLDDWPHILEQTVGGVSYLALILIIPIVCGIITGVVSGWYWQERLRRIVRQLDELAKGQKMTMDQETNEELDKIGRAHV